MNGPALVASNRILVTPGDQQSPLVSIGVPVYNGERFIGACLEMLAAQTFTDYELIIADNCSTDGTPAICAEYARRDPRIRYLRYDRLVRSMDNFTRTLRAAHGTYFLWNAADDARPTDAIHRAVEALRLRPDAVMAHGPVELELPENQAVVLAPNAADLLAGDAAVRVASFTRSLDHNGMLYGVYRRDVLERLCLEHRIGHDYLVCLQMAQVGPIAYVTAPLIRYRHLWGPTHDPMYALEPMTAKSLLADWGARRWKCWCVLARGVQYLLGAPGCSRPDRMRGALAHTRFFIRRYRRHLVHELAYIAATPAAWLVRPAVARWQRLKRRRAVLRLPVG